MSASSLLSEFSQRGIRARPDGDSIVLSPKWALTPDLEARVRREKPTLLQELEKIQKEAGEDWDDIVSNPKQLRAFYELLMIGEMRSKGIAPDHYTATTDCRYCGPVPIWEGCEPEVNGCPWCFTRGRPR